MPRNKEPIPRAPLARLMKERGAARVSKDAAEVLAQALTRIAKEIGKRAHQLAKNAGRKTVTDEDIRVAARERRRD